MTLQLGYNNGENPFVAAQRFIDQNSMEQHYLSQIADWIIARTGQSNSSAPTFDLSSSSASTATATASTTAGKYENKPKKTYQYIPVQNCLFYDEVISNLVDKVFPKLEEFNKSLPGSCICTYQLINDYSFVHIKRPFFCRANSNSREIGVSHQRVARNACRHLSLSQH
jgi:hypothetical protein